jgi:hypothetical protein
MAFVFGVKGVLYHCRLTLAKGLVGEVWECGVYRGETACRMAEIIASKPMPQRLRLFDTFAGMPARTVEDAGGSSSTFDDSSLGDAQQRVWRVSGDVNVQWHVGLIPDTFVGLEEARIQFAYVDLDLYAPTKAALAWIWPRLVPGGRLVLDDATKPEAWPGVRRAAEESGLPWQVEGDKWWVEKPDGPA